MFSDTFNPIRKTSGLLSIDGWILVPETWTRTGNHTYTIAAGDLTAIYRKGSKVKYKAGGGFEYGVIGSSSYAANLNTINLIPNTNYAMAAATITDPYVSFIENPEGWPDTFNYTPVVTSGTGAITSYSIIYASWKVITKNIKVDVGFNITNNGTGAGQVNVTTPLTIAKAAMGTGRESGITGKQLQVVCDATQTIAKVFNYDNTYPGGLNYQIQFNVIFGF